MAFRMIRIVRIFRLFRINAYYDSLNVITEVVSGKKQQLFSSVFIIVILMLASSLCMYSLEHEAQPEVFTDAKQIADHLIAKKTVVLNLETASADTKRRIIDFLVGVAYANGGSLKPVANMTYIITPYNVGFIGEDLVGELENNGVYL